MSSAPRESDEPRPGKWTRRRLILVIAGVVLLALIGAAAWVGVHAVQARNDLAHAQTLISKLRSSVVSDPASAAGLSDRIRADTASARQSTSDPIWRAAELVPVLGRNLTVVRELASAVDDVAVGALDPLASIASTLDAGALKPVDGRIDLAPIAAAATAASDSDDVVQKALGQVERIDSAGTIGPVSDARNQLQELLDEAASLTSTARTVTELVPPMLGQNGPRNYLVAFQNNAEARSLGGNPAVILMVTVDNGALSVVNQAASQDFPIRKPPVALDAELLSIYPPFADYIMDATTRPDFPTAAGIIDAYWQRQFGDRIDGVISFDPVALGYLLKATGPVDLPTGDQLTSDNAVQLLLSEVYARYPDPFAQNAFFAGAASAIFDRLSSGGFTPSSAIEALARSSEEHRLLIWSADPAEQKILGSTTLSGLLPASNDEVTALGVYYNDRSSSKMDYYLETSVEATNDQCTTPDSPTFTSATTLTSALTPDEAAALPKYVASGFLERGDSVTEVYLFGPVGSTLIDTSDAGAVLTSGTDLGRPVVRMQVTLRPGESKTVSARFSGADSDYGPLQISSTPLVRPTEVTVSTPGC